MRKTLAVLFQGEKKTFIEGECGVSQIEVTQGDKATAKVFFRNGEKIIYGNCPFQYSESCGRSGGYIGEECPF